MQAVRQPAQPHPAISVVIVTWNERDRIRACLASLVPQLRDGDQVIVSDNASEDGTLDVVREVAPDAIVVHNGGNAGFPAACNSGAARASTELLVLLNPDTEVLPGWRDAIERPFATRDWSAWQALVTMDGGTRINTSGGILHFTGIAWAGQMGEPVEAAPAEPREVGFPSGACMAIRMPVWRALEGMPEDFFLYFDDVDIALRIRLMGGTVGVEPAARVDHHYEFSRRGVKWRMLERNRWATIIRTYPPRLLWAVLPALVLTDLALLVVAGASGWGGQKALAMADVARSLPRLIGQRRRIQSRRTSADLTEHMTADLSSPYLGRAGRWRVLRALLRGYWWMVRRSIR